MKVTVLHLFPDLMNLYGSYANITILEKTLCDMGVTVEIQKANPGDALSFDADYIFMGAGTERSQKAALEAMRPYAEDFRAAVAGGTPALFAGSAMDMLGKTVTDRDGRVFEGLGLCDFTAVEGKKRIVEDVVGKSSLCGEPVVGFINKSSVQTGIEMPLIDSCSLGFGNSKKGGAEGLVFGNLIASQLTGPILVKNPRLLEWTVRRIFEHNGAQCTGEIPISQTALEAYEITLRELQKLIK